jgi:hypothetical protein
MREVGEEGPSVPGAQGGHGLADLFFGAAGGAVEDLTQTIFIEGVAQLHESGQAKAAIAKVSENYREARDQPSGGGPTKRGAPRVSEMIGQERERRRKAELEMKLSPIELGQVGEKLHEELALLLAKLVEPSGEGVGRKLAEVFHAPVVTDDFATSGGATNGSIRHVLEGGR